MRSLEASDIPKLSSVPISDYDPRGARRRLHETRAFHGHPVARVAAKFALGLTIATTPIVQYWAHDVAPAQYEIEQAGSEINEIYLANNPEHNDTAVVDFAGLGNYTSEKYVQSLDYAEMGRGWAVRYNNNGIDTTELAKDIIEKAEQTGVERFVLVGHSMGGIIALEIAQHIYEHTDKELAAVVLDSSPLNIDCVRQESREKGMEMNRWIGRIPGARYSRILRGMVEMGAREDEYMGKPVNGIPTIKVDKFVNAAVAVRSEKLVKDAPSNALIDGQFKTILGSGAEDDLSDLSQEKDGKLLPRIIFIRPRNSRDDPIVDVNKTEDILLSMMPNQVTIIRGEGIQHANPVQRPDEYRPLMERVVTLALPVKPVNPPLSGK